MKKLYIYITFISLFTLISCVENISQDFEFKEQIFISGLLTNEVGFVSVQVQKTVPVTDTTFNPVNDAQISLFMKDSSDDVSLVSDSFTVNNGTYTTSEMITPIIGNTYWIEAILQDQTVLISEEEILRSPIPITDMEKTDDSIRITFTGPIDVQNFYLIQLEILKDGTLISDELIVSNDRIFNEEEEKILVITGMNEGETLNVNISNINFTTFQFYSNVISNQGNEPEVSSLFLPVNLVGNISNMTTNDLVLGNFGVAGLTPITIDF
ncbi:protein of unknown function [Aquimarina amphilecti]|uniref:DUF4249 domain-containing protein n=1 Tax=Aquimarina amphilecti TaxID=1038014 RepID=A0A1H7S703_AQUAM|nr:DUF4249 family protein [Aquimarina amphilecti]SEL67514.1 protein of unknown function [Aquimarina amphilecti]